MRTVTFSDPWIVKRLNESFVCAWVNKRPEERFVDGFSRPGESGILWNGTAPANVTSVFAMADGTVLHAMAGSQDVGSFAMQLAFALDVKHRMYDGAALRPHGEASYFSAHRTAREAMKDTLAGKVHGVLAERIWKAQSMRLDLFDSFERKDRRCPPRTLSPAICGLFPLTR